MLLMLANSTHHQLPNHLQKLYSEFPGLVVFLFFFFICFLFSLASQLKGAIVPPPQITTAFDKVGKNLSAEFLPPANKVAKVMFSQVSVCPQGCVAGTQPPGQVHPRQVHPRLPGKQSTSGRYASYWNAILFRQKLYSQVQ